jgi:DNA-binding MltR family transcriptional regulator
MLWLLTSPEEQEALEEISAANDRAAAIVSASFLETRVENAVRQRLVDDEKRGVLKELLREGGPIGSFKPRIWLAFALGIYGPEAREDLERIADIRNRFAHRLAIKSFEVPPIKDHCLNLRLVDRFVYDTERPDDQIRWVKGLTVKVPGRDSWMAMPKERYLATVALISTALDPGVVKARSRAQGYSDTLTGLP